MAPENGWLEDDSFPFGTKGLGLCSVAFDVSFRECILRKNQRNGWKTAIAMTPKRFGFFRSEKIRP